MPLSLQKQLQSRCITLEQALETVENAADNIELDWFDEDLSTRFLKKLRDRAIAFPIVPILLWQNCYYLGSPISITPENLKQFCHSLNTDVKLLQISQQSYHNWFRQQTLINQWINASEIVNPLTGEMEQEDIAQSTEFSLSRTNSQIDRIQTIILKALQSRASDIHLEPTEAGLHIRYRIDDMLQPIATLPLEYSRKVITAIKVMCDMDIAESRRPQDGRISEKYTTRQQQEQGLDLRVSTLPCISDRKGETSEKIVMRLLRQKNSFQTIDDLGFSEQACTLYKSWLEQPQGIIILTGPTGSGKTSTLYTSLQAIAKPFVNISTIEDPVEYLLPGITQTQVNETAGMTFAAGLRAILRQDPNIIMIGEIRDSETAETAVRAALTGHLVLTTLHTNDAAGAIPRLKDLGLEPGLISDALLGVVAQRLVRRVCLHCEGPYTPIDRELNLLGLTLEQTKRQYWKKGRGCRHCFNSGYFGREAVIEVLNVDDTVRQIVHEDTARQLQQYLHKAEFDSFRSAATTKVTTGVTTVDEILRVLPYSSLRAKSMPESRPVRLTPSLTRRRR